MEKSIIILPNFTVLADKSTEDGFKALGVIEYFCELVQRSDPINQYKITQRSSWSGMDKVQHVEIIPYIKERAKEIAPNIIPELEIMVKKFGVITLIGDDCLQIKDSSLLEEIKSNANISQHIYKIEAPLVFFKDITIDGISHLCEDELGYPIKQHAPKIETFMMEIINRDKPEVYLVKAPSQLAALKKLYTFIDDIKDILPGLKLDRFDIFNIDNIKKILGLKKETLTDKDIDSFIEYINKNLKECRIRVQKVSEYVNYRLVNVF